MATPPLCSATTSVFIRGKYNVETRNVETSSPSCPPKQLFIVTPTVEGTYPVLLFLHGFLCHNTFYTDLLKHIASHGFITVAPQTYDILTIIHPDIPWEVKFAAEVTTWLFKCLHSVLPDNVKANLNKLALAGHSKGGKAAFSLVLRHDCISQLFSVLLGIDPVAGNALMGELDPKILGKPFNLGIPVMVLGTGLGDKARFLCLPCAPEEYGYKAFFKECQPPRACFVATEYGHMDMLDNDPPGIVGKFVDSLCVNKEGDKKGDKKDHRDPMRRTVGGIVVAFMKAYLQDDCSDLNEIVAHHKIAPVNLEQPIFNKESNQVLV